MSLWNLLNRFVTGVLQIRPQYVKKNLARLVKLKSHDMKGFTHSSKP